jgi:hypothetical protein
MTTDDLIKHYGSKRAAQAVLLLSHPLWRNWELNGIPAGRQAVIQISTDGKLKAGKRLAARKERAKA